MTHLTYIVPAYGAALVIPVWLAGEAWLRLRRARARLLVLEGGRRR
jgi:hypothetical protein